MVSDQVHHALVELMRVRVELESLRPVPTAALDVVGARIARLRARLREVMR